MHVSQRQQGVSRVLRRLGYVDDSLFVDTI